jgi:hypothetical protein
VQEHFLWHFPYLEGIQGVLDGVPRGPVGLAGLLELSALHEAGDADAEDDRGEVEVTDHAEEEEGAA